MLQEVIDFISTSYRGVSTSTLKVLNPATGECIAEIPNIDPHHVSARIDKSYNTFLMWRAKSCEERSVALARVTQRMRERKDDLARLMTLEQGKTLKEAAGEVEYAANFFEWYAEEAKRIRGSIQEIQPGKEIRVTKEPVGVCAAITPWNFPSAMITRKAGAALAAGCTMVIKPAPDTPLSAFAIEMIFHECGLPEGLLQIISGDAQKIGEAFFADPRIKKFSFTGSTRTGRYLMSQAAQTLKKVTLELGGNSPFIVFNDADLTKAASDAMFAKFRNGGQACTSINRFFLHRDIKERFLEIFLPQVNALKVGNGMDSQSDIGPLINMQAITKIRELLEDAVTKGAKIIAGTIPEGRNLFVAPTVLEATPKNARVFSEEIFGPVIAVYTFDTEDEVVAAANNTDYGLASYLYTKDLGRAQRVSRALEYGMVGLNETRIQLPMFPFGGIKHSGFGREGGSEGLEEYLQLKSCLYCL